MTMCMRLHAEWVSDLYDCVWGNAVYKVYHIKSNIIYKVTMSKRQYGVCGNMGHIAGHSIWNHSRSGVFNPAAPDELIKQWKQVGLVPGWNESLMPHWPFVAKTEELDSSVSREKLIKCTQVGSFVFEIKTCLCSFPPQTTFDCLFHSDLLSKSDGNKSTKV